MKKVCILILLLLFSSLFLYMSFGESESKKEDKINILKKGEVFNPESKTSFEALNGYYSINSGKLGDTKKEETLVHIFKDSSNIAMAFSFQENLNDPNIETKYFKSSQKNEDKILDYESSGDIKYVNKVLSKDIDELNNISFEDRVKINYLISKIYFNEEDINLKRKEFFKEALNKEEASLSDEDIYLVFQLCIWDTINKKERDFKSLKYLNNEIDENRKKDINRIYKYLMELSEKNKVLHNEYKRGEINCPKIKEKTDDGLILKDLTIYARSKDFLNLEIKMYSDILDKYILIPEDKIYILDKEKQNKEKYSKEYFVKSLSEGKYKYNILIDKKYIEENFKKDIDKLNINIDLKYKYNENIGIVYESKDEEYKSFITVLKDKDIFNIKTSDIKKVKDIRIDMNVEKINEINISGRQIHSKNIDPTNLNNINNPFGKSTNFLTNITKEKLEVENKDKITFNISAFNEGDIDAFPGTVAVFVPNGVDVDLNSDINKKYLWEKLENNIYISKYFKDQKIEGTLKQETEDINIMKIDSKNIKLEANIKDENFKEKTNLNFYAKLINGAFLDDINLEDIVSNLNEDEKSRNNKNNKRNANNNITNLNFNKKEDRDSAFFKEDEIVSYFTNLFAENVFPKDDTFSYENLIISEKGDLSLKLFVSQIDDKERKLDLEKAVDLKDLKTKINSNGKNTSGTYNFPKEKLELKNGQTIKLNLFIFNEGDTKEKLGKVSVLIPDILELDKNSSINISNGWYEENGYISTTKQKDLEINPVFKVDKAFKTGKHEIPLVLKVNNKKVEDNEFKIIAEIKKQQTVDRDSAPNTLDFDKGYNELKNINIENLEDDTDYIEFNVEKETRDLALRLNVSKVGDTQPQNRHKNILDNIDLQNKKYNSPKDAVKVKQNERIVLDISMFNEGKEKALGGSVKLLIPEGLEFLSKDRSNINEKFGWEINEDGILESKYLLNKEINGWTLDKKNFNAREIIQLELITSEDIRENEDKVIIAEIGENSNSEGINLEFAKRNYKEFVKEYLFNFQDMDLSENKYFKTQEDYTDFEIVSFKKDKLDLSLKLFTENINEEKLDRVPKVNILELKKGKEDAFKNVKNSVNVKCGDVVTNIVRVFNEGEVEASPTSVDIFIPEGMGYIMENDVNVKNLWKIQKATQPEKLSSILGYTLDENKMKVFNVTNKDPLIIKGPAVFRKNEITGIEDKPRNLIPKMTSNDIFYKDSKISLVILKEDGEIKANKNTFNSQYISSHISDETNVNTVNAKRKKERQKPMILFAEISGIYSKEGYTDIDSVPNNLNLDTFNFYKKEDDTDFEIFDTKEEKMKLSLKMGISKIWSKESERSEAYNRISNKKDVIKNIDKKPVNVSEKDKVELKIRVFNEGDIPAFAKSISVYLPKELEYDSKDISNLNTKFKTYDISGKPTLDKSEIRILKTNILSYEELKNIGKQIPIREKDDETGILNYHEISLILDVKDNIHGSDEFKVYAEINEATDIYGNYVKDVKSTYGNLNIFKDEDKLKDEAKNMTIQLIEDDTDYEIFKMVDFNIYSSLKLQGIGIFENKNGINKYIKKEVKENKKKNKTEIVLNRKDIKNAKKIELIYDLQISNSGQIPGYVSELVVTKPNNFNISPKNRIYWRSKNENEFLTNDISRKEIKPEDSINLNLILETDIKKLGSEDLKMSTNITKTYNELNVPNLSKKEEDKKISIKILDISNPTFFVILGILITLNGIVLCKIYAENKKK